MRIKHLIKKGVTRLAPKLTSTLRQLRHIETTLKQLELEMAGIRKAVSTEARDTRLDELRNLTRQIEQYQPTYGIQGVIDNPKRGSHDRCVVIENALRPIPGKRLLDVGSSFGYVGFYMADRGAVVEAWDMHALNIEISQRVGDINGIGVKFRTDELTSETVKTIPPGKFDVVILLSVFHHIVRFQGIDKAQHVVKELFDRIPVMIVELARKGEDPALPWDTAQPNDELAIFSLVKDDVFIKKIGEFKNHLSEKSRPLYLVEKKKTVAVNGNIYSYDHVTSEAYKDSPVVRYPVIRRYYFDEQHIVKEYIFETQAFGDNVVQILNEVQLLVNVVANSNIYHAPKVLDFEVSRERARVVLARVDGVLASDLDFRSKPTKVRSLVEDVLKTLADLENINLYHNDIRSWNVIVDDKGSGWVIDYGMVSVLRVDDDALGLLWMIYGLLHGEREVYRGADKSLPGEATFTDPALHSLYQEIKKGERSPKQLLATLRAADGRVKRK